MLAIIGAAGMRKDETTALGLVLLLGAALS